MKKLSKLCLKNVESVELSKTQMKRIHGAGSGCSATSCAGSCTVTLWGSLVYNGYCDWDTSTDKLLCGCRVL